MNAPMNTDSQNFQLSGSLQRRCVQDQQANRHWFIFRVPTFIGVPHPIIAESQNRFQLPKP